MPTGSVYKRNDGKWCASIQAHGKRKTVYARSEREARRKLADLHRQVASTGSIPNPGKRTVDGLLDAFMATADLRPKTRYGYELTLQKIRPAIGHIKLARLEPLHVQRLCADLGKTSKRNARRAYLLLHTACKHGVLWNWLPLNPCDRIVKPVYRAPRKDVWSPEELHVFLDATRDHRLYPLWMVALTTGCRLGELLALTWEDIDLEAGTIAIRKTLHYVKGQWLVQPPKTKAGERTVVVPPEALQALRRQRVQQAEWRLRAGGVWEDRGLVFTSTLGTPLQSAILSHQMSAICERLGIRPMSLHHLRHLHASLLLSEGLPLTNVSQRLGHASPAITAAVYSHVIGNPDRQAADIMSAVLAKGGVVR